MGTEIWLSNWTFYEKVKEKGMKPTEFVVRDVVCKRIPTRFILNEGLAYNRATKDLMKTFMNILEDDKATGLKKFTIQFTKKIGQVNE